MSTARLWRLSDHRFLSLGRARILWILNATPDSFSDGGAYASPAAAARAAGEAVQAGADAIDIGGESTRPGAEPVDAAAQIGRVVPVIEAIRGSASPAARVPISVDTTLAAVAEAALDAGADAINDTSAGRDDPGMLPLVAARGAGLILMHRLRKPRDDSYSDRYASEPRYTDVVREIADFLAQRVAAAAGAGISEDRIAVDPGLGFGKSVEQNLALVAAGASMSHLPIVSGLSRKSFTGRVSLGRSDSQPDERLMGTIAFSVAHRLAGASIFRVHDVLAHARALRAVDALGGRPGSPAPL